ncbi:MAG: hypothetical protein WB777_25945 [Mycobacterium sp.]
MQYNPPPNWPKPPTGWVPYPDWSPDPSWPPPPPGWKLWLDDETPDENSPAKSELGRLKQAGDDGEYFGDEFAWADDSGPAPADEELDGAAPAESTEVAPEDLSAHHLGRNATIKWEDDRTYDIGKIIAIAADAAAINVKLAGIDAPVSFRRESTSDGPGNPRLFVWI